MAYEYKLPKITLDDAKAMTPNERTKTLEFEKAMRKTKEAQGFSWNKKGWPADVLQDGDSKEKAKWVALGSPKGDESVEDIMGLRDGVRKWLQRHTHAWGTGVSAVRTLRRTTGPTGPTGPTGGRRTRKTRRRLTKKRKDRRV